MKRAGYSEKSLVNKLGYKPGDTVYIFNAPWEFIEYLSSENIIVVGKLPATWAHGFFTKQSDLQNFLKNDFRSLALEKGFWVSWPKKSSGIKTDLTEQAFRDIILPTGWVDVKVAAIDDTWSGLKFLRRISAGTSLSRKN